ncbi:MAG: FG-GAP-like repeat-containing protein [Candidatus Hodarchaeota archaeon]
MKHKWEKKIILLTILLSIIIGLNITTVRGSFDNQFVPEWNSESFPDDPHDIAFGDDVDKDGIDEIVIATAWYIQVLEHNATTNNYEKTWNSGLISSSSINAAIATNDLDNDGFKEYIFGGNGAEIFVVENNGTNDGFQLVLNSWLGDSEFVSTLCEGGDLDRDGNEDFVVGTDYNHVFVFEYNGTDNGYSNVWSSSSLISNGVTDVCMGNDLDSDGLKEIVVSDSGGYIHVFENTGDNAFSRVWINAVPIGTAALGISIADDLDDDGKPEIVVATFDNKTYVIEHNGTDNGYEMVWNSGSTINDDVNTVCIGPDIDGDGKKELISGSRDHKIYIFECNGTDNGYESVWNSGTTITSYVVSLNTGDPDSDGLVEIFTGSSSGMLYSFERNSTVESNGDGPTNGIFLTYTNAAIAAGVIFLAGIVLTLVIQKSISRKPKEKRD